MSRYATLRVLVLVMMFSLFSGVATASTDLEMAEDITQLLAKKFNPESVNVIVLGSHAYAEMKGAVISRIRVDTIRLDALLNSTPKVTGDVKDLAQYIALSKGELVLLEKDVNDYFAKNEKKGFKNLKFDFIPEGFTAAGLYSGTFIININIRLNAKGTLALRPEGIDLDKVSIYVEGVKQPSALTNHIVNKINPLLEFKEIPFPVTFKKITISDTKALLTGFPKPFEGGSKASYERGK